MIWKNNKFSINISQKCNINLNISQTCNINLNISQTCDINLIKYDNRYVSKYMWQSTSTHMPIHNFGHFYF